MKTFTKIHRILLLTVLIVFVAASNTKAQTTLFTEDWESASIGQTPPTGWGVDLVTGSNYTFFEQTGYDPGCFPFSGNRMVEFHSDVATNGTSNRLKRTTAVSTSGYPYVTIDFEWYVDTAYYDAPTEGVYVQWSTNGTTWTTAGTIFQRSSMPAQWVLETQNLPAGAANQATLYIALLFNSNQVRNCHLDLVHIKGYTSTPPAPTVTTNNATGIGASQAVLHGTVNANGYSTTASFQYGLTTSYGSNANAGTVTGSTVTSISASTGYLAASTLYHYRAVGNSAGGTSYGPDSVFTTTGYPPYVYTDNPTNITSTSATLNGVVDAYGSSTTVTFQYGLTTSYGSTVSGGIVTGNINVSVSAPISGLTPSTSYHYRVVGTNANGTSYGADKSFTTLGSGSPPTVTTNHATNITATSARLNGHVNPNGYSTNVSFEYGFTTSYGSSYSVGTINGSTNQLVYADIYWLSPATNYHFRAVASNAYGTTYGNDSVFTTLNAAPDVILAYATNITTTSATLNDSTRANGLATTTSFEYGLTASYGSTIGGTPGTVYGNTYQFVTANITGLTPATTYHLRGKGVNSMGTGYDYDTTFTTLGTGPVPTVVTMTASGITANSATLNGHVNANGYSTTTSFQYGLTTAYGNSVAAQTVTGNTMTPINASIYGLSPATTYHFRAAGTNANGTAYGNDSVFTTLAAAPSVVTQPATNINQTIATLNGTVNANGATTTVSFDYGLTPSYGSTIAATPNTVTGNTVQSVTAALVGLVAGTTYHFRIKGVNSYGTSYGSDYTFTTLSAGATPPTVITYGADMITHFYARMIAHINANGSLTTASFQYGTTTAYGSSVSAGTVSGNNFQIVSAIAYGLSPGTLYHYRGVGSNAGGTAYGADSTFYTNDTIATVVTLAATSIGGTTATLNGSVNPNGDPTTAAFEYGLSTAYGNTINATPATVYGNTSQAISTGLTGLLPNHTYHYRAKGVNSFGTAYGVDMTFTTTSGSDCQAIMSYTNAGSLTIQFHDISTGEPYTRYWHFGDGATSSQSDPLHVYPAAGNYTVRLYIYNTSTYCHDSAIQIIQVSDSTVSCQAQFTWAATADPNTLQFTDLSTGTIDHWLWNFDDDSSSVVQNPSHIFPGPGNYYVCLAIEGPDCLNTSCQEITVGNVTSCVSYFTYIKSGLDVTLYGHMVNGLAANYNWSFGDGQVGIGQSVLHTFPSTGVYYVTLTTIDSTLCTYSSGQTILVGDSAQFLQLYGQVFAGEFPAQTGMVALFSVDTIPPYVPYINISNIDSDGVYYFPMVPQGDFYIYAIPFTPEGFLPTYYGGTVYWEDATIIHLGVPVNPYNINLLAASDMMSGNGSIHGQINLNGLKSSGLLGKIVILLMNSEGKTISYLKLNDQGTFAFPSLAYGTYYLKAEIAGVKSDVIMVVLSPDNPQGNVVMTFTGNTIIGIPLGISALNSSVIYPNPVSNEANIELQLTKMTGLIIELRDVTGREVLQVSKKLNSGKSRLSIPTTNLPVGFYSMRINFDDGTNIVRKFIKN
ncbi:MAG: PKD domain-containing protein [Bacteroidetes bacterium]|nr:PKD domain-containing protein [Bacteroidota bacterium]